MSLCATVAIGLHLATAHFSPGYESFNPGVYAVCDAPVVGPVVAGAYRNSEGRGSAYVGKVFALGQMQIVVGAVTGYQRQPVLPLLVPSLLLWDHVRLSVLPPFGNSKGGITFAWEF